MTITKIEKKIMQISSVKAKGGKSRKSEKEGKGFRVFDFITFETILRICYLQKPKSLGFIYLNNLASANTKNAKRQSQLVICVT